MKRPSTEIISEEEFLQLVQQHSVNFLKIYNFLQKTQKPYTRKFYAHLIKESEELETFLDDHYARENKNWCLFSEFVACTRKMAQVMLVLKHTINRFPAYSLDGASDSYLTKAYETSDFLIETIISLFQGIKKEALNLGIRFPRGSLKDDMFGEIYSSKRLPTNIDKEDDVSAVTAISKIATQYIDSVDQFNDHGWNLGKISSENLQNLIPDKVNEEESRKFIATVHNLQSAYDHYIKNDSLELKNEKLKTFRIYISLPLHLLTIVNRLSHLFQRYLRPTSRGIDRKEIFNIIDREKILDIIINFSLYYAGRYFRKGKTLADNILATYVEVETCEIALPEKTRYAFKACCSGC